MSASNPDMIGARPALKRQIPSFVAIGVFGYFVDSAVTYILARQFGVDPILARAPAFALATVLNFALNRTLTFQGTNTPILQAFFRYVLVCAAGLVVNYSVYAICLAAAPRIGMSVEPFMLPLFVACGSGLAMFVTYFGFRFFAFRS